MTQNELEAVMMGHYRDPAPARLLDALRYAAEDRAEIPPHQQATRLAFFAAALRADATLWLRAADGALIAASVTAGGAEAPWIQSVFTYDVEAPIIEAPKGFIDAREQMQKGAQA